MHGTDGNDEAPDAGAEQHTEVPAAEGHDGAAAVDVNVCTLLFSVCISSIHAV